MYLSSSILTLYAVADVADLGVTHPFHFALCQEVKGPFDSTH
jgi:hypothetical protein